jgi:ribonuclease III
MANNTLSEKINYTFKQAKLLKIALTHCSKGGEHNERLEFLGDSVVNFVIADLLYQQFPKATEGELSRWRATLVNRDTLAELAKLFDLGPYLLLGPGEIRTGGHARNSILSCAMEALIGAVYIDSGFLVVYEKIKEWYQPFLKSLSSAASHKDPKTVLQEFLQSRHLALPLYTIEEISGEAHQQSFTISCQIDGMPTKTYGKGSSRRRAEQDAAAAMLEVLKK